MQLISNFVHSLLARIQDAREEGGQTLVEYGLIVALLSIACIVILATVGDELVAIFTRVATELSNATP